MVLALLRFPPFTAIFLGAIAGGVLAVFVAPDRVIKFADAGELPAWLALLKGVWLALASGYHSTTGFAPMDMLATRGGMDSMLNTIWLIVTALAFGGVVEKVGVCQSRARAGRALARGGRHRHAHVGADSLEQLRRLHGCNPGRSHLELRTICCVQLREPAADDCTRVCSLSHAAPAAGLSDGRRGTWLARRRPA